MAKEISKRSNYHPNTKLVLLRWGQDMEFGSTIKESLETAVLIKGMSVMDIANGCGLSERTIAKVLKDLNLFKHVDRGKRKRSLITVPDLLNMSPKEIARKYEVSLGTVYAARRKYANKDFWKKNSRKARNPEGMERDLTTSRSTFTNSSSGDGE